MISTLKTNGNTYYCSNCLMKQFQLKPNCPFCGNMFSNYESILTKQIAEELINDVTKEPPPKEIRGLRKYMGIIDDNPMIDPEELKKAIIEYENNK